MSNIDKIIESYKTFANSDKAKELTKEINELILSDDDTLKNVPIDDDNKLNRHISNVFVDLISAEGLDELAEKYNETDITISNYIEYDIIPKMHKLDLSNIEITADSPLGKNNDVNYQLLLKSTISKLDIKSNDTDNSNNITLINNRLNQNDTNDVFQNQNIIHEHIMQSKEKHSNPNIITTAKLLENLPDAVTNDELSKFKSAVGEDVYNAYENKILSDILDYSLKQNSHLVLETPPNSDLDLLIDKIASSGKTINLKSITQIENGSNTLEKSKEFANSKDITDISIHNYDGDRNFKGLIVLKSAINEQIKSDKQNKFKELHNKVKSEKSPKLNSNDMKI